MAVRLKNLKEALKAYRDTFYVPDEPVAPEDNNDLQFERDVSRP